MLWNSSAQPEELERGKSCNGREGGGRASSSAVLGDHLRKHLPGGFLGNVDFVDKIYGGNVGEYLASLYTIQY